MDTPQQPMQRVVVLATTPDHGLLVVAQPSGVAGRYQLPQAMVSGLVTFALVNDILQQTLGMQVRVARPTPDIVLLREGKEESVFAVGFNSAMLVRIDPSLDVTVLWRERLASQAVFLPESDLKTLAILPEMLP